MGKPMEPYLGDVIGQPRIVRPSPKIIRPTVLEPTIRWLIGLLALPFYAILIAITLSVLVAIFLKQDRAIGQVLSMPRECEALGRLVGLPPAPTLEQASWAIEELQKREHDAYPGVKACREAVRKLKKNLSDAGDIQMHWLYKIVPPSRSACNFLTIVPWALFGNDEDGIFGERSGVPTYGKDAPVTYKQFMRWTTRNPFHNLVWHVLAWPGGPYYRWGKPGVWYGYIGFRPPEGGFGFVPYRRDR